MGRNKIGGSRGVREARREEPANSGNLIAFIQLYSSSKMAGKKKHGPDFRSGRAVLHPLFSTMIIEIMANLKILGQFEFSVTFVSSPLCPLC